MQRLKAKLFTANVYSLIQNDGDVFYVGCTTAPLLDRLKGHIGSAMLKVKKGYHLSKKDRIIIKGPGSIKINPLETFKVKAKTNKEALTKSMFKENQWIMTLKGLGYDLTNLSNQTKKAA